MGNYIKPPRLLIVQIQSYKKRRQSSVFELYTNTWTNIISSERQTEFLHSLPVSSGYNSYRCYGESTHLNRNSLHILKCINTVSCYNNTKLKQYFCFYTYGFRDVNELCCYIVSFLCVVVALFLHCT